MAPVHGWDIWSSKWTFSQSWCVRSRKNGQALGFEQVCQGPNCDGYKTGSEHLQNCTPCGVFLFCSGQHLSEVVQGRNSGELAKSQPRRIDAHRCVVRSNTRAAVAQINEELHAGSDRKVSKYIVHHSLLCMGWHSRRPARVPMLSPIHRQKCQQWVCEHQNWTKEQWKKGSWSDKSHFHLHHVDGRMRVRHLLGEHMAPGCTMGRSQVRGGSVMLWSMFCWESLASLTYCMTNMFVNYINHINVTYKTQLMWFT